MNIKLPNITFNSKQTKQLNYQPEKIGKNVKGLFTVKLFNTALGQSRYSSNCKQFQYSYKEHCSRQKNPTWFIKRTIIVISLIRHNS